MLQRGTAGGQSLDVRVTHSAVGGEEEFAQARQAASEILETSGAALEGGTPAQVQLLQHSDESRRVLKCSAKNTVPRDESKQNPPAATDELQQTSIGQVSAAPQVQRAEEAGAGGQHAGDNVVVLNLQERGSISTPSSNMEPSLGKTSAFL